MSYKLRSKIWNCLNIEMSLHWNHLKSSYEEFSRVLEIPQILKYCVSQKMYFLDFHIISSSYLLRTKLQQRKFYIEVAVFFIFIFLGGFFQRVSFLLLHFCTFIMLMKWCITSRAILTFKRRYKHLLRYHVICVYCLSVFRVYLWLVFICV